MSEIALIYEQRRLDAIRDLQDRKETLYREIPELKDIDDKIKEAGIALNKIMFLENIDESSIAKELFFKLKDKKSQLLRENNLSEADISIKYFCGKCDDTGFITQGTNSEKCSCYRMLLVDNLYKSLSLDPNKKMTFDRFEMNYYSEKSNEEKYRDKLSPRERMQKNLDSCHKFIKNFNSPETKNLIFYGSAGLGKTFMCGCIANAIIEQGIPVLYISAPDMFNIITAHRMGRTDGNYSKYDIHDLINTELLIIDDLGTENLTEARAAEFLEILNKKKEVNERRPCHLIITTNLSLGEIHNKYSERISSRISGEYIWCDFIGEDIRNARK